MSTIDGQDDAKHLKLECEIFILRRQIAADTKCITSHSKLLVSDISHAKESIATSKNYLQEAPVKWRGTK